MRYEAPNSIESAVGLLAAERGQTYVLAGGTDLLVRLRSGFIEPDLIVDLKGIDRLKLWEERSLIQRAAMAGPRPEEET